MAKKFYNVDFLPQKSLSFQVVARVLKRIEKNFPACF